MAILTFKMNHQPLIYLSTTFASNVLRFRRGSAFLPRIGFFRKFTTFERIITALWWRTRLIFVDIICITLWNALGGFVLKAVSTCIMPFQINKLPFAFLAFIKFLFKVTNLHLPFLQFARLTSLLTFSGRTF